MSQENIKDFPAAVYLRRNRQKILDKFDAKKEALEKALEEAIRL